jgi:type IV secretion system protein TrbL
LSRPFFFARALKRALMPMKHTPKRQPEFTKRRRSPIDQKTKVSNMKKSSLTKCLLSGALIFGAAPVFATISDAGLLNDVTNKFLTQSATWGSTITSFATYVFWVLATISMVWTFGMMALRKADVGEFFAEFVKFTITTGFFWWLLSNGPQMAIAIIDSLRKIGAQAGGLPNTLTPSTPVSIGFDIVKKAFGGLSWVHPIDNLAIVLISGAVVICMAAVAANVLIALVTGWALAYAGVFILGFGGSRWTSDMAISYFKAMLAIGLELMTMTLLIGISTSVVDGFYQQLDGSSVYELLLIFCVCAVLALLIDKIPTRVAALAGGGSGASVGAGSVVGAAALGAMAGASAGAALASGATSLAGGAQALMAAFSKANAAASGGDTGGGGGGDLLSAFSGGDSGGSGGALASAMGDGGSGATGGAGGDTGGAGATGGTGGDTGGAGAGGGGDTGGGGGASPSAGKSGMAATAAKVGKVAAGTFSNLAQGAWGVAKAKTSDMKDATMERIGETTGGKIAAAIKASDVVPTFNDDSLSAGGNPATATADANSEVAAFRDGNTKTT